MVDPSLRSRVAPGLLALALVLASCGDETGPATVEPTLEWSVTPSEIAPGAEAVFHYRVEGNLLDQLRVVFGDGETAVRTLGGSQSAEGQIPHAFDEPGVYTVSAELTDGVWGPVSAQVTVTVTASASSADASRLAR